ncbi:hypothetical protein QR680_010447 [Steinernema hermaphroditum]|uniref:Uncharacterized protein n=1 Tax=Steinernema hermaphroditum TaxID=289476 RepID=A0AA39IP21_9BILA|nr:hypothetical protein QR680_010447 [Steinernema hermaphroditum]
MNSLPANFYDQLFPVFMMGTMCTAQELSGTFGMVAKLFYGNHHDHELEIENNLIINEELYFFSNERTEKCAEMSQPVSKKYTNTVCITLRDTNDKVSKEFRDRIQNRHADYELILECSTISPAWMKWALALPKLTRLCIAEKLEDAALDFCKSLVERGRLRWLELDCDVPLLSKEMDLIKIVLCQKQFKTLTLEDCVAPEDIFKIWEENREKMTGKKALFVADCRVVAMELKGDLELCSEEECEYIEKEHLFLYRSELRVSSQAYKIKSELIADDKHNVYVFFECEEKGLTFYISFLRIRKATRSSAEAIAQ